MSTLGRRLTALEVIAEDLRTRPIRRMVEDLAREYRLTPAQADEALAEALASYDQVMQKRDALIRAGLSEREIHQRYAYELGVPVAEFEAECERVAERYFS